MTDKDRDKFARWEAARAGHKKVRPTMKRLEGIHLRLDDAFDHDEFCRAYARGLRVVREAAAEAKVSR